MRITLDKIVSVKCVLYTDECDMRSNYVKCDTCKQAVHEGAFENHRQDKKCTSMQEHCLAIMNYSIRMYVELKYRFSF